MVQRLKKWAIVTGIGIISGVLIYGIMIGIEKLLEGKFSPGTTIAGIDASYKSPEQIRETILQRQQKFTTTPILISFDGKEAAFLPDQLGIYTDAEDAFDKAYAQDPKSPTFFQAVLHLDSNIELPATHTTEYHKMRETLNAEFYLKDRAPQPATFEFDEKGDLSPREGKAGVVIDEEKFLKELLYAAENLTPVALTLEFTEKDTHITIADIEPQKEELLAQLNHKVTLVDPIYSDDWRISLNEHREWVEFIEEGERTVLGLYPRDAAHKDIQVGLNTEKFNAFIDEKISKWLDVPAQPVNIYKDEAGKIMIEGTGIDGKKIQRDEFEALVEKALVEKTPELEIPVLTILPEVTVAPELADMGIKERLGVGHTSYYGSPANRIHNIKIGAARFNGKLIAPEEVFSFNQSLGPVDGSQGYRKELVIKKEGTIPEFGGGLCQVSTTVYRAILFSGFPIVARRPHSYAVSYYSQVLGHGLDATIYLGGPDLKFQNDTGNHVLMQTYVKNDHELYVVFYGTSPGRTVKMEGPYLSNYRNPGPTEYIQSPTLAPGVTKQVEKPHTGFNALWYRYVTDSEGKVTKETIESQYRAVPAKILVGPAAPEATPAL